MRKIRHKSLSNLIRFSGLAVAVVEAGLNPDDRAPEPIFLMTKLGHLHVLQFLYFVQIVGFFLPQVVSVYVFQLNFSYF